MNVTVKLIPITEETTAEYLLSEMEEALGTDPYEGHQPEFISEFKLTRKWAKILCVNIAPSHSTREDQLNQYDEYIKWLEENCVEKHYYSMALWFKSEDDAMLFKLRFQ